MNPEHVADAIASGQYVKADELTELARCVDQAWYGSDTHLLVRAGALSKLLHEITERRAADAYHRLGAADQATFDSIKETHVRRPIPRRMSHTGQGYICATDLDLWPCATATLVALIDRNLDTREVVTNEDAV